MLLRLARRAWGAGVAAAHLVVPVLRLGHVGRVLGAGEAGRAFGGAEAGVGEHVHAPLRAAELVVFAQCGHQMGAVVNGGVRALPWVGVDVGVFDADAGGVGGPVAGVPCGVGIPDELADATVRVYLVVRRRFAGLPHVVASGDTQIAGVVVDDNLVDVAAGAPRCEVRVEDHVLVRFEGFPIFHAFSFRDVLVWSLAGLRGSSSVARRDWRRLDVVVEGRAVAVAAQAVIAVIESLGA